MENRSSISTGYATIPTVIRIFLSHSSKDFGLVDLIRAQAQAIEVDVYLHEMHPEPGTSLSSKVADAIGTSDALVVLVTANTAASAYVNQEIGYALGKGLPVIPLVSRGTDSDQLAMLQGVEYIAFDSERPHGALTRLTAQLHGMQMSKTAQVATAKEAEVQAALTRQRELSVALGFICVLLILYVATSGGEFGSTSA